MIALLAIVLAAQTRDTTFTYSPDHAVKSVNIAGTFNNWNKDSTPMRLDANGRSWSIRLPLAYGVQQYKFVIDGSEWIVDPARKAVDDGNGHQNTLLLVAPPDFDKPASPNDGIVAASGVLHTPTASYLNYDRGTLSIRLRTRSNDVSDVELMAGGAPKELRLIGSDELYATYEVQMPWNRKTDLTYNFRLTDGPNSFWYGSTGLSASPGAPFRLDAKTYKPFEVPSWVEKSVFYQIFPDRFANGETSNDPADVMPWGGKPSYSNRFGGDAVGVTQHVGYLADLGIGAIYFNPVFKSPSNHRYDTTDYLQIDPQFGTNQEFSTMTSSLKSKGIRSVMDIAFNHTAVNFKPFQDIRDRGRESAYTHWYFVKSYPVVVKENPPYVAWDNYPSMPKLNMANPDTRDFGLNVLHYWMKEAPGVEGYRFDVANEIDDRFWRAARADLKQTDPNIWMLGEEWGDASHWLQGDEWDASMDYPFREACLGFFANKTTTATQFMNALMQNYGRYAPQVSRNELNLIGSHDTPRFLTMCHGDLKADELAAAVQFTWAGAPCIYYGDEIGMEGGVDPDNRRCMDWSQATHANPVLQYYKSLIRIRKSNHALQSGDPKILATDDGHSTVVFARELPNDFAIVAVNRGAEAQTISIPLPKMAREGLFDALSGRRYSGTGHEFSITLSPMSAEILLPSRDHASSVSRQSRRVAFRTSTLESSQEIH